jgi:chorismate mutase
VSEGGPASGRPVSGERPLSGGGPVGDDGPVSEPGPVRGGRPVGGGGGGLSSGERLVALRGATTVDADTADAVTSRTSELLSALLRRNAVEPDQLVSIIFTSTRDLRSAFPALAARELGLGDVPLLCAGELDVIGGNPNTIRVLIHCYSTLPRPSLRHVYLHGARHLRDDLPE